MNSQNAMNSHDDLNSDVENELTSIIRKSGQGDRENDDVAIKAVYDRLRSLAGRILRTEKQGTLQPTALVNEALIKLLDQHHLDKIPNRGYFFSVAAKTMRRLLVDEARKRNAAKRGGNAARQNLESWMVCYDQKQVELLELDSALDALEKQNVRQTRVVHLRWFVGFSVQEIAELLDVAVSTVEQDWRNARTFLFHYMK